MNRFQSEQLAADLVFRPARLRNSLVLFGSAVLFWGGSQVQAAIIYVRSSAAGANSGTSWANAYTDLQVALADADPGDQIWVAQGAYRPASIGGFRISTFRLKTGVAVYGGFVGNEVLLSQRNPNVNETILSGDLNSDDYPATPTSNCCFAHDAPGCDDPVCEAAICPSAGGGCCTTGWNEACAGAAGVNCNICGTTGNSADNVYHVVTGSNTDATARLDGFTITGGHVDESVSVVQLGGGGMVNIGGSPTVINCRFVANFAGDQGAGMLNAAGSHPYIENCSFSGGGGALSTVGTGITNRDGSSPTIVNCTFLPNQTSGANVFGGGLVNLNDCHPLVVGCQFIGGIAVIGGAVINDSVSNPTFVDCLFAGNEAGLGGAVANANLSAPTFIQCVFSGNSAGLGGAIRELSAARSTIINCTFANNAGGGGAVAGHESMPIVRNSVFYGNTPDSFLNEAGADFEVSYSSFDEPLPCCVVGDGNISMADPMFIDANGSDNIVGTIDDDLRLSVGSPCIDSGNSSLVPSDTADLDHDSNVSEPVPVDFAGGPRFFNDPDTLDTGIGSPPIVDMGAFEFFPDCNNNSVPDSIDIAQGIVRDIDADGIADPCDTLVDCNQNGMHDPIEIANGSAVDIDDDGIIDTCDSLVDCNHNGIADATDIADGTLHDQNGDGIADTCDPSLVPTVSQWGLIVLALLLLVAARVQFGRPIAGK